MNFSFQALVDRINLYFAVKSFNSTREQFYEDLADAVHDGELISKFISVRKARAAKQKDPKEPLYQVWLSRMNKKGGKLSYVLQGSAPDSDIMVLKAIEDKGDLESGLRFIGSTIKDQQAMASSIKGAIFMPAIVATIMVVFMVILSVFVIPVFADIAPPEKWNGIGRVMYAISYSITHFGIFILAAFLGFLGWFSWSLNNWTGDTRQTLDKYLPYRVYRDYKGSIFMVSLASMLHSGDTLVNALEDLKKSAPIWLRWHINRILKNIDRSSENYGEAFNTGIFSKDLTNRLVDLSRRSSEFDKVIQRIGIEGVTKVRTAVEESAKKLNIVLIAVLGCCLAFMLVGTLLTAQGLSTSLKEEVNSQRITR